MPTGYTEIINRPPPPDLVDALDAWLANALEWSAPSSDYTRRLASAIDARILALVAGSGEGDAQEVAPTPPAAGPDVWLLPPDDDDESEVIGWTPRSKALRCTNARGQMRLTHYVDARKLAAAEAERDRQASMHEDETTWRKEAEAQRDAATARAVAAEERASKAETLATAERQTRDEVVRRVVELERDRTYGREQYRRSLHPEVGPCDGLGEGWTCSACRDAIAALRGQAVAAEER